MQIHLLHLWSKEKNAADHFYYTCYIYIGLTEEERQEVVTKSKFQWFSVETTSIVLPSHHTETNNPFKLLVALDGFRLFSFSLSRDLCDNLYAKFLSGVKGDGKKSITMTQ